MTEWMIAIQGLTKTYGHEMDAKPLSRIWEWVGWLLLFLLMVLIASIFPTRVMAGLAPAEVFRK